MSIRNFCNFAYVTMTLAFKFLPMSLGSIIILSSPFAVALMSQCLFNDAVDRVDIGAMLVSFTGLAIMADSKPVPESA